MNEPLDVALQFIRYINGHNIGGITALMTEDHRFIDSLGAEIKGRSDMRNAWIGYFVMIPDYTISIQETFVRDDIVIILGKAWGTYSADGKILQENAWELPLALRAVVRNDKIAEWRVYADNEPVRSIINRHTPGQ
jgi:ketosteroid isomerase-like protein